MWRFSREVVQVEEALNRISPYIQPMEIEEVSLLDSIHRYIAEEAVARHHFPPFHRSGYDGYAITAEDTVGATRETPVVLQVREEIPCGKVPNYTVDSGFTSRIMTGAEMPDGANAVIMLEKTEGFTEAGSSFIKITEEIKAGANVTPMGFEVIEGEKLFDAGTFIGPGEVALLATFGYSRVKVYKQPRVAIFSTGSELLNPDEPLQGGKIRNSNSYMLASLVRQAGALPLIMDTIPDHVEEAKGIILKTMPQVDLMITTGGVSVGDYDILTDIFAQWEGKMLFNKVAIKPGGPTTVGRWQDTFLFALSGNPGACFVGFELFVKPVLYGMQGMGKGVSDTYKACLFENFCKTDDKVRYLRGITFVSDGKIWAMPVSKNQSSVTVSIREANCLIVIPAGNKGMEAEELVDVIPLHSQG